VRCLYWAPAASASPGSIALRATEPAERFPPIRVTIPWRKRCYNFCMTEMDCRSALMRSARPASTCWPRLARALQCPLRIHAHENRPQCSHHSARARDRRRPPYRGPRRSHSPPQMRRVNFRSRLGTKLLLRSLRSRRQGGA
jgi:hypothetical protein